MRPAVVISLLFLAAATEAYFVIQSTKSHIYAPLRENKTPVIISECGKLVKEPFGILEHTFKKGSFKNGDRCTWNLHAPPKHVVNIISKGFNLEDRKPSTISELEIKRNETSFVSFYDGVGPKNNYLTGLKLTTYQGHGGESRFDATSSNQDMFVEVEYNEREDYDTQKVRIEYEFLEYEKMIKLLREY